VERIPRALAHSYHQLFADAKDSLIVPVEAAWTKGVYHLYVVRVQDREALQAHLASWNCHRRPLPDSTPSAEGLPTSRVPEGAFPVTERVAAEIVSLPMFPQLSHTLQKEVVEKVVEFVESKQTVAS